MCIRDSLQPVEKTVIDRAVRNVYRPFLADPDPATMPILGEDVYKRQDLSGKLLSIGSGFSAAFSNALPSFAPMDLLIGIVGRCV